MRTSKKFLYLKVIAGILFFLFLYHSMSVVLQPKWTEDGCKAVWKGFYAQPKDSINVLYLGSSQIFCDVSPLIIWDKTGITGYNISTPMQPVWTSYYCLEECLKTQTPKIVVLDALGFFFNDYSDEVINSMAYNYMKWSKTKWIALKNSIRPESGESIVHYLFPIIRYHSRWKELQREDFIKYPNEKTDFCRGYRFSDATAPYSGDLLILDNYMSTYRTEIPVIGERTREYLDKLVELCENNGIRLVIIKTPSVTEAFNWDLGHYEVVKDYCNSNSLDYFDLNFGNMIDWNTDSMDAGNHLNYRGAQKVSERIAAILTDVYGLSGCKGSPTYVQWDKDYCKLLSLVRGSELRTEENIYEFLDQINDPEYMIIVTIKGKREERIPDALLAKFHGIGMNLENYDPNESYIFIKDGDSVVTETNGEGVLEFSMNSSTNTFVYAKSVGITASGVSTAFSSVYIDGIESSRNIEGVNIIVYSNISARVVDVVVLPAFNIQTIIR